MYLKKLKEKAKALKNEVHALVIVYKDKRTPLLPKLLIGLTIGYLFSPIDLIPDFIPILGLLDDLIIVPLLIKLSVKLIPDYLFEEAKSKVLDKNQIKNKSNWFFAALIIILWLSILLYIALKVFRVSDEYV
jgi:uncharacterized membrane protein YkvA (DUF1232 family)